MEFRDVDFDDLLLEIPIRTEMAEWLGRLTFDLRVVGSSLRPNLVKKD